MILFLNKIMNLKKFCDTCPDKVPTVVEKLSCRSCASSIAYILHNQETQVEPIYGQNHEYETLPLRIETSEI